MCWLALIGILLVPGTSTAQAVISNDVELVASEFFSDGTGWPYFGSQCNGSYYYNTGFVTSDPIGGQEKLFLFTQGGQSDSADLWIDSPNTYQGCGADEVIQVVIDVDDLDTPANTLGYVFNPQNTIRISPCKFYGSNDQFMGHEMAFWDHRTNTRYVMFGPTAHNGNYRLFKSTANQAFRTWTEVQELQNAGPHVDKPIWYAVAETPNVEYIQYINGAWTVTRQEWHGLVRFNQSGTSGARQWGFVKVIHLPLETTYKFRIQLLNAAGNWQELNPANPVVNFSLLVGGVGEFPTQIFWNGERGRMEAWFIGHDQLFWRQWYGAYPGGLGQKNFVSPVRPSAPHVLTYQGALRFNYNGTRYLITSHNDTNVCDQVPYSNSFQGLHTVSAKLSYY
jgi:hypothetical protein